VGFFKSVGIQEGYIDDVPSNTTGIADLLTTDIMTVPVDFERRVGKVDKLRRIRIVVSQLTRK
jgi:hypothetical protein